MDANGELEDFTKSYLIASLWSSSDDDGTPIDMNYGIEDFSEDTLATMKKDCELFFMRAKDYIFAEGCPNANDGTGQAGMAGHDFWLTRNGHGAGFWDGDWPKKSADKLTSLSKEFGSFELFIGDDNKIIND